MDSKITLSLNGNIYEDAEEIETILNSHKYKAVIFEFDQHLRSLIKYGEEEKYCPQDLRSKLYEIVESYGVRIE